MMPSPSNWLYRWLAPFMLAPLFDYLLNDIRSVRSDLRLPESVRDQRLRLTVYAGCVLAAYVDDFPRLAAFEMLRDDIFKQEK